MTARSRAFPTEPLLTTAQVAELIGMRPSTVTRYARTGVIKAVRMGKARSQLRFHPADVRAYIASLAPANR